MHLERTRVWIAAAVAVVVLAGAALAGFFLLRPQAPGPRVSVSAPRLGSVAEDEVAIAVPIEAAIATRAGVEHVRTEIDAAEVKVTVTFSPRTSDDAAVEEMRRALGDVQGRMPAPASPPVARREPRHPPPSVWILAKQGAAADLMTSNGVASVEACGARERRLAVVIDPSRLAAMGLEVRDVLAAAGTSSAKDAASIASARVGDRGAVHLSDVATVEERPDPRACAARTEDGETVFRVVLLENTPRDATVRALRDKAASMGARLVDPRHVVSVGFAVPRSASPEERARIVARLAAPPGGFAILRADGEGELVAPAEGSEPRALTDALRRAIVALPGPAPLGVRASPAGPPPHVRVLLAGDDLDALDRDAREVRTTVQGISGVGAFAGVPDASAPELEMTVDRARAARLGIPSTEIADAVRVASTGVDAGAAIVTVRAADAPDALRALIVRGVPLSSVVGLRSSPGRSRLVRIDRRRAVELVWEIEGPRVVSRVAEACKGRAAIVALDAP